MSCHLVEQCCGYWRNGFVAILGTRLWQLALKHYSWPLAHVTEHHVGCRRMTVHVGEGGGKETGQPIHAKQD